MDSTRKYLATTVLLCFVVGCANRPESIRASHVSHEKYMHDDCTILVAKKSDARAELARVSSMQDSKATGDAIGVFLILVPFSKLTGDHEADVAKWKGEVEAIETAQTIKKCMGGGATHTTPAAQTTAPIAPATLQPIPVRASTATAPEKGQFAVEAERLARSEQCATTPVSSLTGKGPGFETYSVSCSSGDVLSVRCDFGTCRVLR